MMRPHAAQVLAVFRMLNMTHVYPRVVVKGRAGAVDDVIDFENAGKGHGITLANHVAQIRTGQGKSVTLAGLSSVLALVGYEAHCVCYSEYLSSRDLSAFKVRIASCGRVCAFARLRVCACLRVWWVRACVVRGWVRACVRAWVGG